MVQTPVNHNTPAVQPTPVIAPNVQVLLDSAVLIVVSPVSPLYDIILSEPLSLAVSSSTIYPRGATAEERFIHVLNPGEFLIDKDLRPGARNLYRTRIISKV